MTPPDPSDPPQPPPVPPAPPPPELIKPPQTHVPLTPMMDFFQRRLESLERELALARERAGSAERELKSQASIRTEVEVEMRSISEQLRREKTERESGESQSMAKGRIEALEKRLDEMHQTWAQLLREVVARGREGPGTAESAEPISQLAAAVRRLDASLPQGLRSVETALESEVAALGSALSHGLADAVRRLSHELSRQEERLAQEARERAALSRAWEERDHALRQETQRERLAQDANLARQLGALAVQFQELLDRHGQASQQGVESHALLQRAVAALTAQPKARDVEIAELQSEVKALADALRERSERLRIYSEERRQIESTLGESLVRGQTEVSAERERARQAHQALVEAQLGAADLKDRLAAATRALDDAQARHAGLAAERDELVKSLAAASEAARSDIEGRRRSDEDWRRRLEPLQEELRQNHRRGEELAAARDKAQSDLGVLSGQLAKALQEKDAAAARGGSWERERAELLETLRKKDDLIAMLSASFQGLFKK